MTDRYRFDDLGWLQFERLCQAILKAKFGPAVISWGGRSDRGRDAYCEEALNLTNIGPTSGPFVFQAKFVTNANAAGARPGPALLKAVQAERDEIISRQKAGTWKTPARYILMTNVPMTASLRIEIAETFDKVLGGEKAISWGADDLSDLLYDLPNLRVAFPQILSVRDFDVFIREMVNHAVVERSLTARLEAESYVSVFVPTKAYDKALETLQRHSFVVLTGPPEMGKTTIARMLGLAKHSVGWQFIDCSSPQDFFQNLDDSVSQIFVADDALVGGAAGEGRGFYFTMTGMSGGRVQTSARANGVMQAALNTGLHYARSRRVFGQPIANYPLSQARLGRMAAWLTASRQLSYRVGRLMDGGAGDHEASLVKLFACRAAEWVTRDAMQLHGGLGYAEETLASRLFVDARVLSIFEGAEETLALKVIARERIAAANLDLAVRA